MGCNSCGGTPVVTPPKACDNCLAAPRIEWLCQNGPAPGGTMSFNIDDVGKIRYPSGGGVFNFELFDFDPAGYNSVMVAANGDISISTKKVFKPRKKYRIRYKIRKANSKISVTGEIFICFRNTCAGCPGNCDQLEGDCIYGVGKSMVNVECDETYTFPLTDWQGWTIDDVLAGRYDWINKPDCIVPTFSMVPASPDPVFTLSINTQACLEPGTHDFKLKIWNANMTSYEMDFLVSKKDLCKGVICGIGQACNSCSGICEDISGNVSVGSTSSGVSGNQGNIIVE